MIHMQVIVFKIVGLIMKGSTLSLTWPISHKLEIIIVVIWFWTKVVVIIFLYYLNLCLYSVVGFDVSNKVCDICLELRDY